MKYDLIDDAMKASKDGIIYVVKAWEPMAGPCWANQGNIIGFYIDENEAKKDARDYWEPIKNEVGIIVEVLIGKADSGKFVEEDEVEVLLGKDPCGEDEDEEIEE